MKNYIGQKLDNRYEILELVGTGGMAHVYKAKDCTDGSLVAVKILKKDESQKEDDTERRFRQECTTASMLTHPNIVKTRDVSLGEATEHYIVMEYIDGITLKDYIEGKGKLDWKDSIHFVTQILRALNYAHGKGVVHRDIKPQNIMVMTDGTIKVMDFGIARLQREESSTRTNQAVGSVHYISPEQAKGKNVNAQSDLYSLGIVMYEMLTGCKPFENESVVSIAMMHVQDSPKAPTDLNPNIPLGLEDIIMHAMEKEQSDRYPNAKKMLEDIETFRENPSTIFGYVERENINEILQNNSNEYLSEEEEEEEEILEEYEEEEEEEEYDDDEYEEEEERSLFVPILTAVIVVVIIVAVVLVASLIKGALFDNTIGTGTKEKAMPDLVGLDYNEAIAAYSSLDIQIESYEYSDYEKDIIFEQDIPAGDGVEVNAVVMIKVSKGVRTVQVPNVNGWQFETAKSNMTALGLRIEEHWQVDDNVDKNCVIRTEPEGLSEVDPGSVVAVYISKGPNNDAVDVPNFLGMDISDAETAAHLNYLEVVVEEVNSNEDEGKVLRQSTAAGTKVAYDTVITLTVSNGVPPEGDAKLSIALPEGTNGSFLLKIYEGGQNIQDSGIIDPNYAGGNATITLTGSGQKDIIVVVQNSASGETAQLGSYHVNFEKGTCNPTSADIKQAFDSVGLIAEPTSEETSEATSEPATTLTPGATTLAPTEAPTSAWTAATDAPATDAPATEVATDPVE